MSTTNTLHQPMSDIQNEWYFYCKEFYEGSLGDGDSKRKVLEYFESKSPNDSEYSSTNIDINVDTTLTNQLLQLGVSIT